jgi:heme exporter protein B
LEKKIITRPDAGLAFIHNINLKNSRQISALLKKDLLLETRQQHTLYGILLYIASTIFVIYLTLEDPDASTWNAIFWITQLFICINAVAKSFLQEAKGRMLYYYTITSPVAFILSKLAYNAVLMIAMSIINLLVYTVMLGNPTSNYFSFCMIGILGGCGLGLIFTMLAAIASKALQQASLMAILGFPLILPQLMMLVRLSKTAFGEIFNNGIPFQMIALLLAFDLLMIILSVILFPFLWKD